MTTGTCKGTAPLDGLSAAMDGHVRTSEVEQIERTCPNCGSQLDEQKCKLVCPKCFYFKSCSDF
jgi:ribosomal protein S27AE